MSKDPERPWLKGKEARREGRRKRGERKGGKKGRKKEEGITPGC
jgi:hypothetical protein